MRLCGIGLAEGLKVTLKHLLHRKLTEQYPEERPSLFPRFRGKLVIEPEKCIACGICVRTCPNGALSLQERREEMAKKKKLDSYQIDHQYCMFCNLCVENCPTGCLRFSHEFEWAAFSRDEFKVLYKGLAAVGTERKGQEKVGSQEASPREDLQRPVDEKLRDDKLNKKKEALKTAFAKDPVNVLKRYVREEEDLRILVNFLKIEPRRSDKLLELMAEDEQKASKVAEAFLKQARKKVLPDTGREDQ